MRSLKKAAPLLVQVSILMIFFWLLFAIIGVQSFKSSFRRQCVWLDSRGVQPSYVQPLVFCGGQLDNVTGEIKPYVDQNFVTQALAPKGYICPQQSWCMVGDNPYNGTVSFDNIANSLELIYVIMSSNTWSDLMYYTAGSDHLSAALFFAFGIVILSMWLMTLFLAVITSSFGVIRGTTKQSAFSTEETEVIEDEGPPSDRGLNRLGHLFQQTEYLWLAVILYGLVVQATRTSDISLGRERFNMVSEIIVTFILDIEILLRILVDFKKFWKQPRNLFDLLLAVVTTVMQVPQVRLSGEVYAWLSIFQILRMYRLVMAIRITRETIEILLKNWRGLVNLVMFVILICYLGALFAVQLFRGEIPQGAQDPFGGTLRVTFFTIWNAFLGMYQIFSSENWTAVMYGITAYGTQYNVGWIGAVFCILWFTVASVIILSMFIAVIQEAFDPDEDEKRAEQVKYFVKQKPEPTTGTLSLASLFSSGFGRERADPDPFDHNSALARELLSRDKDFEDFINPAGKENPENRQSTMTMRNLGMDQVSTGVMTKLWTRIKRLVPGSEYNPFYTEPDLEIQLEDLDIMAMGQKIVAAAEKRRTQQREYLIKHPKYNVSLFIFKHDSLIRRMCQRLVGPGRGHQRPEGEGVEPNKIASYLFAFIVYLAIGAMVILAIITTPLYMKIYFETHPFSVRNWFVFCDMAFAIFFTIEALIRVIADGFFFAPNAFFRGAWGIIDGIVLATLWINVGTSLANEGSISRAVGAFKALRALRLLHISKTARETFYAVIIMGGVKLASVAFVSLSLLIPFAIWGVNLFNGKLVTCNDTSVTSLNECVNEFMGTPFNNLQVLVPRVQANPYYNFDSFGASLFILFQTVSQEGWIDVMWSLQSIVGIGMQPQNWASQGNAVFMVLFNLLGAVFIVTLFISVFMKNYTETTGVAFFTPEQRAWMELRKLLKKISPSKRPSKKSEQSFAKWCYRRATQKHGWWSRFITVKLCAHCVLLMLEFYPEPSWWETTKLALFLAFTLVFGANVVIRITGLTWARYRRSSWDLYALGTVCGALTSTILVIARPDNNAFVQIHKLFLVSIALLLIPRNNQLDQLFKTAAASFSQIGNLFITWFVLFLVFSIAMTQTFSLTRFGGLENGNLNFRTVAKAMIVLFRMSMGEAWNQIMEDYATIRPPFCNDSNEFYQSDCGSAEWARGLFVAWNILSMYLFVNLVLALIYESFSYVYQQSTGLNVISREEIRRFKHAWATVDPEGTGFVSKADFPKLLREFSGVFLMSIYSGEHSVGAILDECRSNRPFGSQVPSGRGHSSSVTSATFMPSVNRRTSGNLMNPTSSDDPNLGTGVDLHLLRARINQIPIAEIRRRRTKYIKFYEEAMVSAVPGRGLPFNHVLMLLAYYNVIVDYEDLNLEEFIGRRKRLDRVNDQMKRSTVQGFFDMLHYRRKFMLGRARKAAGFLRDVPQLPVPEILVEGAEDDEDRDQAGPSIERIQGIGTDSWSRTDARGQRRSLQRPRSGRLSTALPPDIILTSPADRSRVNDTHFPSGLSPGPSFSSSTGAPQIISGHGLSPSMAGSAHARTGSVSSSRRSSISEHSNLQQTLADSPWGQSMRRRSTARRRRSTRDSRGDLGEQGGIWSGSPGRRTSGVDPEG